MVSTKQLPLLIGVLSISLASLAAGFQAMTQAPPTVEVWLRSHGVSDSTPALRNALKNPNPEVRSLAAGTLALRKDTESIPLIREALQKEQVPNIKVNLEHALATLQDWQGNATLIDTCNDRRIEPSLRLQAANKLLDLGGNECTPSVVEIFGNKPDPPNRALGLQFLRRVTTIPILLMPKLQASLVEGLKDPAPMNRQYASECLSVFGNRDSLRELENAVANEKDPTTRQHLEENLRRAKARFG
jgi:HEAT repeat protein